MTWTKEQEQAINAEGTNIIVSAGAGSGKTAVLTARVQRKLLSGIHINELLVLTFTNAAAAEMKDRIISSSYCQGAYAFCDNMFVFRRFVFSQKVIIPRD